MKIKSIIITATLIAATACTSQKWSIEQKDGFNIVHQNKGRTLGYSTESGISLITDKGYAFKDLNKNGTLDTYEDWRRTAHERAEDLARQLSIEEIAGLMLYSKHQTVPQYREYDPMKYTYGGKPWHESGADTSAIADNQLKFLGEDNVRHVLLDHIASPAVCVKWVNNIQSFVEGLGHGIPINISSDPRHETLATDEFNSGSGGKISLWPTPIGMAATFDPTVAGEFGRIASLEFRALGIATNLAPQAEIATDPRWRRFSGTFGEDPQLAADFTRAYIDGFQTSFGEDEIEEGWGYGSVNCMVKHWPGGGSGEGGRDAHLCFGKYAVFPGNNMQTAIDVFKNGAFNLDGPTKSASAIMPYYTISYGQDPHGENVGNSYSRYIIDELLRGKYRFEGVGCTDWGITRDCKAVDIQSGMPWGVENLSVAERHYKIILAGMDQFGGNDDKKPVLEAYRIWRDRHGEESARKRFELSAYRLLLNFFRTGIFENPYLDVEKTCAIVGCKEFTEIGYKVQQKSAVMVKNHAGILPIKGKAKIYMPQRQAPNIYNQNGKISVKGGFGYMLAPELAGEYFEFTSDPSQADFAFVAISEPVSGRGYDNGYQPISLQYGGYTATEARKKSLAGGDPLEESDNRSYYGCTVKTENSADINLVKSVRKVMGDKPVIVGLSCTKPVVVSEFEPFADAIIITFGVHNRVYLDIISGRIEPSGLLPMQFPANMATVERQFEDTPHDMECHTDMDGNTYDFAFGMNWDGPINDDRVKKYRK
ncbi:MAG: glycoside hydrolase family 3 protein [Bacteroidales bacterium]|nr:glycoside hydrolase family 3 protein [Bacteroidales bacterium]